MFRLGIIEESLKSEKTLNLVNPYFFSQRIEDVPDDEYPTWHINEYHVSDENIEELLNILKDDVKLTWYVHAFSDNQLYVVLPGKFFSISLLRDDTWNEMIEYGVKVANVEREFLEYVPLHV
nr:hypothetical protein [uncultured Anaerosporobacter sp.]